MKFLAYARLVRLPNVFTAFADIAVGFAVYYGLREPDQSLPLWWQFAALFLASGCLYTAGMVWNDFFDLAEDRKTRPNRPLVQGIIKVRSAFILGSMLLLGGCAVAFVASNTSGYFAMAIAIAVMAYNYHFKHTKFGPLSMASCRFLNVLLGVSLVPTSLADWPLKLFLASIVGVYIVGVTWFARTEEKRSNPKVLKLASGVILAALLLAVALPSMIPGNTCSWLYPYSLVAFGGYLWPAIYRAVKYPTPTNVQGAVKRLILGLVFLDAILASAFAGTLALVLVVLLIPAKLLGKWIYST